MRLEDIINEATAEFGKAVFADPDQSHWDDSVWKKFLKLQGLSLIDSEVNTKIEDKLLKLLVSWTKGSDTYTANQLAKMLPVLQKGRRLFPDIFKPDMPNGTIVYRGLDRVNSRFVKSLAAETEPSDWVETGYYSGLVICKKPVSYTPHRLWQSWTYDSGIAEAFGPSGVYGGALITKQDNNFYMNTKAMYHVYQDNNEKEILHFGKEYTKPVYFAASPEIFEEIQGKFTRQKPDPLSRVKTLKSAGNYFFGK